MLLVLNAGSSSLKFALYDLPPASGEARPKARLEGQIAGIGRTSLCHGPYLLNRLVSIGYGLRDEHLNVVIENALARGNFNLLAFAYSLTPEVFARWSPKKNVVIVTSSQCALNGETGPGHPRLWSFEELTQRV